ncbi:MAG: GNAT family N-acetyltransferase [Polyangiaceae bacterium]|jgi:predicted GNAT family acetyltransferase
MNARMVTETMNAEQDVAGPHGTRLVGELRDEDVRAAVALVADEYWNVGVDRDRLARAIRGSTVVVGALDATGHLIATARALSDGARSAWIGDVCVAKAWRGKGLGLAVVRRLLAHPLVRDADRVRLNTRDAQGLYERLGFVDTQKEQREKQAPPSTEMVLRRR